MSSGESLMLRFRGFDVSKADEATGFDGESLKIKPLMLSGAFRTAHGPGDEMAVVGDNRSPVANNAVIALVQGNVPFISQITGYNEGLHLLVVVAELGFLESHSNYSTVPTSESGSEQKKNDTEGTFNIKDSTFFN